jgi:hypothetical protein
MFLNLVLEECSPWKEDNIGNGMTQKRMGWTAIPMWDIHLLAPTTIVYQHHQCCSDDKKAVERAIHTVYNTGYSHFYHMGSNEFGRLVTMSSPLLKMFHMAKEKFNNIPFGDPQVGYGCQSDWNRL